MADHVRMQIRNQVVTQLTGLTTTAARVFDSRVYPLEDANLPALLIYTKSETSEPIEIGTNRTSERLLSLNIEAYVKSTTNFEDTLDTICKEVEQAIAADPTLSGKAKDCYLESTEIEFNAEGEKPLAFATLTFLTSYYVQEQSPDVAV
jgi:hypothetical protein|tara:strand:+ start:1113 stop:1559 length:447 start_codon:yes stop_codon:yes gene_type:complete